MRMQVLGSKSGLPKMSRIWTKQKRGLGGGKAAWRDSGESCGNEVSEVQDHSHHINAVL